MYTNSPTKTSRGTSRWLRTLKFDTKRGVLLQIKGKVWKSLISMYSYVNVLIMLHRSVRTWIGPNSRPNFSGTAERKYKKKASSANKLEKNKKSQFFRSHLKYWKICKNLWYLRFIFPKQILNQNNFLI